MNLESQVLQVHVEDIIPNRFQPRLSFDEQGLKELSDSIKEHGIIQPLVLRKLGDKYEIIAGERRYKAAQIAGLQTVPAVIANIDDNKSAEVALVENVQRRDLTAIEEARSYKSLLDKGYLTQDQLAKRMGLSQPAIANKLRLLNLDEEVQQALLDEKISERHARTLLTIEDKNAQREWLHRIINERLTVRQLDLELKKVREANQFVSADDEDEGTGEVPLVSAAPSIEEIKANAVDLGSTTNKPLSQPVPETEVLETLDPLPSPVTTNDANFSKATTIPEFNIATPNSASTLIPQGNIIEPVDQNKFFNLNNGISTTPTPPSFVPLTNSPSEITSANLKTTPIDNSQNFEIFDAPTTPIEKTQAQAIPESSTTQPSLTQPNNIPISPLTGAINNNYEGSFNNKFFTPVVDNTPELSTTSELEKIVDPMARVDQNLTNTSTPTTNTKMELKDAIAKIRNCIEDLGNEGFFINVEEIDFDTNYQITMQIHKDNH